MTKLKLQVASPPTALQESRARKGASLGSELSRRCFRFLSFPCYFRHASTTRLKGQQAAVHTLLKPPALITSSTGTSPVWDPSAASVCLPWGSFL